MANIKLTDVQSDGGFDFKQIYEHLDYEDTDSPFTNGNVDCNYYSPEEFLNNSKDRENCRTTSYFHSNCRSLSHNWDSLVELLCEIQNDNFNLDFIGLSEVYNCERDNRLKLKGYHDLVVKFRTDDGRGGIGLFIKEEFEFKIRNDISCFIPHVYESIFIEIINKNKHMNQIIGVIYRPNTEPKADIDIFTETMIETIDIINNENKKCVLMGDLNIDFLKYGKHAKTNDFIDNLFARGFVPQITKPTRICKSSATLIDHIITNNTQFPAQNSIILSDISDHYAIIHTVEYGSRTSPTSSKTKSRIFSEKYISKFNDMLRHTDFSPILNINDPEEAYNAFIKLYKTKFDLAFPKLEIKKNKNWKPLEPWVTNDLLESRRMKNKLLKLKLEAPTEDNINQYKQFVNKYNKTKRNLKKSYLHDILEHNKGNMKKTWSIINSIMGTSKKQHPLPRSFNIDNKPVSDPTDIAECFNNYFANIGKQTACSVPSSNKHFSEYLQNPVQGSIFIEPVDEFQILKIVNRLKGKSSSGHDEIPTKIIKRTIFNILTPLTDLINKSLLTGCVPKQLKLAKITPIFKTSDSSLLKNYRPISLLPAFSKVYEKVMYMKILNFLNCQNLFYKHQYGFRPKHSTVHPIIHLLNECATGINSKPQQSTLTILCDLSKAFDVISREILLKKLEHNGIRGIANTWIANYLSDRYQYVAIDNGISSSLEINCGVPQGSILGPLLYLIYVNDISTSTNCKILSFADDTSICMSDSNIKHLYETGNCEIAKVFDWFCANRLSLNPLKTKFIVFNPPKISATFDNIDNIDLKINGISLEKISTNSNDKYTKFLGLHVDDNLTWEHHINQVNNKISRALYAIKQVRHFLPNKTLQTLYYSMIHPHLCYGLLAWGNSNLKFLNRTIKLQKRAIRLITKSNYNSHTSPLFGKCKIMKLPDLFEYEVATFMHKYVNHKLPISFQGVFSKNQDLNTNCQTRQYNLLHIKQCSSVRSSRLPLFNFPRIWNKFSTHKANISYGAFKKKVKNSLLSSYSSAVFCSNAKCKECNSF